MSQNETRNFWRPPETLRHIVRKSMESVVVELVALRAENREMQARLARIEQAVIGEGRDIKELTMASAQQRQALDSLKNEATRQRDAVEAMKTLLTGPNGLFAQLDRAGDDVDEIKAVTEGFRANTDTLVASAIRNTQADTGTNTAPADNPIVNAPGGV